MLIDILKTPVQNLIDLIIDSNPGKTLTNDQFTTAAPQVVAEPVGSENTTVELTAVLGQGYSSSLVVSYTRQPLNAFVLSPVTELTVTPEALEADVLATLVTKLEIMASEVTSAAFTAPTGVEGEGTDGSITVTAKPDSLLYIGTWVVVLKPATEPAMEETFTGTDLDGFTAPDLV